MSLQKDASGMVVAFAVKPVGGGDARQFHPAGKPLEPVRDHLPLAPDDQRNGLTAVRLAFDDKAGGIHLPHAAFYRDSLSRKGAGRLCYRCGAENAAKKNEQGGQQKERRCPLSKKSKKKEEKSRKSGCGRHPFDRREEQAEHRCAQQSAGAHKDKRPFHPTSPFHRFFLIIAQPSFRKKSGKQSRRSFVAKDGRLCYS